MKVELVLGHQIKAQKFQIEKSLQNRLETLNPNILNKIMSQDQNIGQDGG